MINNPFIDEENHRISDEISLNLHYNYLRIINSLVSKLREKAIEFKEDKRVEDVFVEELSEFLEGLGDIELTYLKPLEQIISDASSYEDHLKDLEHERQERPDYHNQGLLRRRF